ncbi:MAG: 50S ribosomal protein L9 [Candidatus Omnitrophica bacterium]|nr:50S ribosomal protein L9 [Candidatus Omnitrophota bacterium]
MQVILKKDIEKLGRAGEIVSVKDGYARNFLLLQNLALLASAANLKVVEREKEKALARREKEKQQAGELANKIASLSCTITMQAGPDGKLYGSVTNQDVAQAYKAEGIDIDKRKIELPQPIKEVGVFKINVKLHPEITAQAKVWVVKE